MSDIPDFFKPLSWFDLDAEVELIKQEELAREGFTTSADNFLRRATGYVLMRPNKTGGLDIFVQDGWKRAMRGKQ